MENEMRFFIYLIESYADYKNTSTDVVMKFRDKLGLTDLYMACMKDAIRNV